MHYSALPPGQRVVLWLASMLLALATGCTLNTAPGISPVVISGAPVVTLAAPPPGAAYLEGVGVNVQALIANAGADIDRVEIAVDNTLVDTQTQPNADARVAFTITYAWQAAGVGEHTVSVTAFRTDGSSSAPAMVTFTVVGAAAPEATPEATPEDQGDDQGILDGAAESESDSAALSSAEEGNDEQSAGQGGGGDESEDEEEPKPSPTPSKPIATFTTGVNVRRGPGTNFNPPIGSYAAGNTAEVVGVNPSRDWYKVRYYNADGWVAASLMTIAGDTSNLPVDAGPPTPVPATATSIPPTEAPATAAPQSNANLVAGNIRLDPSPPVCGKTFDVRIDLANLGSEDTASTGIFNVQDIHVASGQVTAETQGPIPIIKAGVTVPSDRIKLTVSTYYNEQHRIVITLNPNSAVPESTNGDNKNQIEYTLQRGDC